MRKRVMLGVLMLIVGLASGLASADHFDSDPGTGTFNPQMTTTITQGLVNRPTGFTMRVAQQDHEDPPIYAALRAPGDWQFDFGSIRLPEDVNGVVTTSCSAAVDGYRNSPNGTGTGTQLDFTKRSDARFARIERLGTSQLQAHADGISRPGSPITWNGNIAFLNYNAVTETATLCLLLVTSDTRVTSIPDPSPAGRDDIEDVTEILVGFPLAHVNDASGNWWQVLVDEPLEDLMKSEELQTLNASLISLSSSFTGRSAGNWHAGGRDVSRAPATSGLHNFQGVFRTCPANDPAFGACQSGRAEVVRTIGHAITLPAPAITSAGGSFNTNPLPVSGTSDPNASVQVYAGGIASGAPATANPSGVWTANVPLSDGSHTLTAKTVDAGGASPVSNSITVTIDTTPPAPPVIGAPGEGVTLAGTFVTLTGTAEPSSSVDLEDAGLPLGSVNAGTNGSWSFASTLAKGPHAVTARATDGLGNVGAFGPVRSFNVTTAIPSIVTPTQGGAINQASVTFTGISEGGATVTIDEAGTMVGSPAVADLNGSWSISAALPEGEHMVTATAVKDGFTSPPTAIRTFLVDLTAPIAPVIAGPTPGQEVRSISVPVFGTAEPFTSAAIFEGVTRVGSAAVDAAGNWATTVVLADGEHTIKANVTDRAGNVGPFSPLVTFLVNDPLEITRPLAGSLNPGSVTIAGTADAASSQVRVFEGFAEIGRAPVADDGTWSFIKVLTSGSHTIRARAVTGGTVGPLSDPVTFTVDATNPVVKIKKPSGYLIFGRLLGDPLQGYASDAGPSDSLVDRIEVTYVNLLTGDEVTRTVACSACPGASVTWSDMPNLDLGFYDVTATAYDKVGNTATESLLFLIV